MLVTNLVSVYHFARTGDTEDYPSIADYSNVNACITPASTDIQLTYGGESAFQLYEVYVYDMTIVFQNGDKIIDDNGAIYFVAGVAEVVNNRYLHYTKLAVRKEV